MTNVEVFIACLCCSVFGKELPLTKINDQDLQELYVLSNKHDLGHLVCDALQKNSLLPNNKWGDAFQKQKDLALYRYIQQSITYEEICQAFEKAKIPYVPLKGALIRTLYPEPWMRTSCDIDILVNMENLEQAISILVNQLGFAEKKRGNYDVALNAPSGVHFELHFQLRRGNYSADDILDQVWKYAKPVMPHKTGYQMTNEFFLFHYLAHMSYHFIAGGCGIKPLLDCFLLSETLGCNQAVLDKLLEDGGIKLFANRVFSLSQKLFGAEDTEMTEAECRILNYIVIPVEKR